MRLAQHGVRLAQHGAGDLAQARKGDAAAMPQTRQIAKATKVKWTAP